MSGMRRRISDEQLDEYRRLGTELRVIHDGDENNDVRGVVVAWNEDVVLIRKRNRKVVKCPRDCTYLPYGFPRNEQV